MTNNYLCPIHLTSLKDFVNHLLALRRLSVATFLVLFVSFYGQAQDFTVTTTADGTSFSGTVNLRGAILRADALGGTHTITVPAGTYNLIQGEITFGNRAQTINIIGASPTNTIINMAGTGPNQDRIFSINPDVIADVHTNISGIKFTNGHLKSDPYGGGAIIAGGANNSLSLSNCAFENNTIDAGINSGAGGGAVGYFGGGTLSIDQCTFTGNTLPSLSGGAVDFEAYGYNTPAYTYPNNALSITNSTFTNNAAGSNGAGGAINVSAGGFSTVDPPRPTLSVTISKNSFINNNAPGSGVGIGNARGGAISATNSFSPTSVFYINYNRFVGNTAASGNGSALATYDTQGSVDATNNWWGCNSGPTSCADKAYRYPGSSSGTLMTTPYLQLRTIAANSTLCSGNSTGITSGFTTNSAGTPIAASNLSAFTGVPITFSPILGTITNAQTSIQSTGTATATFTAGSMTGTATVNAIVDNVPANDLTARASITVNAAPAITDQPDNATTCAGTTVTFSAAASGSGTLSYQWYKGTTALANGATGTGSTIAGATTPTLTITNPGAADAAANYNLRVTSTSGCSVTSTNASLVVNTPPTISSPPSTTTVCAGSTAQFSVSASGSGTLSYQWFKGTTALTNGATGTGSSISGATTANLSISNVSPADAASNYSVRISSSTGCTPVTSATAALIVNSPPSISSQPASGSSVQVGASVRVPVGVSGQVTAYQWYRDGAVVSGQTSATLTLSNVQLSQAGSYSLVASNSCGSVSSTAFSLSVLGTDLVSAIYVRPSTVYGPSSLSVVVEVSETNGVSSSGLITVRVSKPTNLTLSFDSSLSSVGGRSVQNGSWSFSSDANSYILTSSASIPGRGKLSFGLSGQLTPGSTSGMLSMSSMVVGGSGSEQRMDNNADADKVEYFQQ